MKAITIETFGGPEGLAVTDLPDPVPAPGEVLIDTEAIGVGGVDALIRSGALGDRGFKPGHVPGSEVAGTVSAVGPGVDAAWVGRRVWAFVGLAGGYAERAVAPETTIVALPPALSAVDAVTVGSSGAVAHFALEHARLALHESVLVRGAAGGLGTMAVQLAAKRAGAVAVTTSSAERGDRLRALGATQVLDRAGTGTDTGFDVIVDVVAGPDLPAFLTRLNPNGRLVAIGVMGGLPPADFGMALIAAFQRSLSFATFSLDTVPTADRYGQVADQLAATARGELSAVVHEVLPLHAAARAHAMIDAGEVFGRVALTT